jgi:hypothetical protein
LPGLSSERSPLDESLRWPTWIGLLDNDRSLPASEDPFNMASRLRQRLYTDHLFKIIIIITTIIIVIFVASRRMLQPAVSVMAPARLEAGSDVCLEKQDMREAR